MKLQVERISFCRRDNEITPIPILAVKGPIAGDDVPDTKLLRGVAKIGRPFMLDLIPPSTSGQC